MEVEQRRFVITMQVTPEQVALAATCMNMTASAIGDGTLDATECRDTAAYFMDDDNWTVSVE